MLSDMGQLTFVNFEPHNSSDEKRTSQQKSQENEIITGAKIKFKLIMLRR